MPRVPRTIVDRQRRSQNVGVNALARELDLPQTTVSQLMSKGKTRDEIRAYAALRHGKPIPPKESDELKQPDPPKPSPAEEQQKSEYDLIIEMRGMARELEEVKLRRAKALAEKDELRNRVEKGELLPKNYVKQYCLRFLYDTKFQIDVMPSEFADVLAAEPDPRKTEAILQTMMDRLRHQLEEMYKFWYAETEVELPAEEQKVA
jgi:hypothetical protein